MSDEICNKHGCIIVCEDSKGRYCEECLVDELKEHLEKFSKETIARWIISNASSIDSYDGDFWWIPADHFNDSDVRLFHLREMEEPLTRERYKTLFEIENREEKYQNMKFEKEERRRLNSHGWEFLPNTTEDLE